jgi:hypothetical protein
MNVHGGPVWHWRPRWLGRANLLALLLLARGYVVFFPNPRGSSGRLGLQGRADGALSAREARTVFARCAPIEDPRAAAL